MVALHCSWSPHSEKMHGQSPHHRHRRSPWKILDCSPDISTQSQLSNTVRGSPNDNVYSPHKVKSPHQFQNKQSSPHYNSPENFQVLPMMMVGGGGVLCKRARHKCIMEIQQQFTDHVSMQQDFYCNQLTMLVF